MFDVKKPRVRRSLRKRIVECGRGTSCWGVDTTSGGTFFDTEKETAHFTSYR